MAGSVGPDFRAQRRRLVELLQANGISDLAVLRAIEMTPRHLFVASGQHGDAYKDGTVYIGAGQYMSHPSVHARYLQLLELKGHEKVLEVGTGSGYQTVLLSHLTAQVFSIERVATLLANARRVIQECGVRNVSTLLGDGTLGWRDYAPYDAILVGAGGSEVPRPLLEQLTDGGRLLIPLGDRSDQMLVMFTRRGAEFDRRDIAPARFVPLKGIHGW